MMDATQNGREILGWGQILDQICIYFRERCQLEDFLVTEVMPCKGEINAHI